MFSDESEERGGPQSDISAFSEEHESVFMEENCKDDLEEIHMKAQDGTNPSVSLIITEANCGCFI
jgi:hypothetical protein